MPFLRFHRDKRGYEHFYLVEATTNRRGKTRARVLYWFRTPPNVKVGRQPFDPQLQREIEAQHPGITFDWRKIQDTPIPSAEAEQWRERRRQERIDRAQRKSAAARPAQADRVADEEPDDREDAGDERAELSESESESVIAVDAAEQQADALAPTEESLLASAATVDTGEAHDGETPDADVSPVTADATVREVGGEAQGPAGTGRRRRRRRRGRRGPGANTSPSASTESAPGDAAGSVSSPDDDNDGADDDDPSDGGETGG